MGSNPGYVSSLIFSTLTGTETKLFTILRRFCDSCKELVQLIALIRAYLLTSLRTLKSTTSVLVYCCCELSHVIFLKLRKKDMLAKLSNFTK